MPDYESGGGRKATPSAAPAAPLNKSRFHPDLFPLLLLLVVIAFYWKLTLTKQFDWMWSPDLAQQVLPWFIAQARQWHSGHFPLWDPYLWGGQPFIGQAQPGAVYPLNWILLLLPMRGGVIRMGFLQWYFVIVHYMAALFCYWLCRDLRRSRAASLFAGLAFSLAGFLGFTLWPQMMNGAVWAPLIFLFLLRAARGYRPLASAALSGMFFGFAWLSGHHQIPLFTGLAVAGAWLYFIFRQGPVNWRIARLAVVSAVVMFLMGAAQILPAYRYGHLARRWVGAPHAVNWNQPVPYSVHQMYSLLPHNLLDILFPYDNGNLAAFLGLTVCALALLGIASRWRSTPVRLFSGVALGGIVYAVGAWSFVEGLLYAIVPSLDKARSPYAAIFLLDVGAAVLAAFGFDSIRRPSTRRWGRWIAVGSLGVGVAFTVLFGVLTVAHAPRIDEFAALTPLVAFLLAALLHAYRGGTLRATHAGACLILLLLFEISVPQPYNFADRSSAGQQVYLQAIRSNPDIAAWLRAHVGTYRAETDASELTPNWGEYHDIEMWGGYLASITTNMRLFEGATSQMRSLFGVRYSVATKPLQPGETEVYQGASGMKVFENNAAFPRAWAVHQAVRVGSQTEADALIRDHLADLSQEAFLFENPPELKACGGSDRVTLLNRAASESRIQADLSCDGMVVVSDTWYPGWTAQVDGKSTRIWEVDGALRGVLAPKGSHVIDIRYRPGVVYIGALLSLLGFVGALLIVFTRAGNSGGALISQRTRPDR